MAFNPSDHMMKLKGKDYLQVAWRLVWFREQHPDWSIDTSIIASDADHAIFRAVICDENGVQKCTGHGSESKRDFGDYLEKAETKAVGRALAMMGFGTQFTADELDEGEHIVDLPLNVRGNVQKAAGAPAQKPVEAPAQKQALATPAQREIIMTKLTPGNLARAKSMYGEDLENMPADIAGETLQKLNQAAS